MTREEIISQGRPVEPDCFETDREEQWYKVGLYDGATASHWHSVADGDLPKEPKGNAEDMPFVVISKCGHQFFAYYDEDEDGICDFYDDCDCPLDVEYWMEIPQLPEKGGTE